MLIDSIKKMLPLALKQKVKTVFPILWNRPNSVLIKQQNTVKAENDGEFKSLKINPNAEELIASNGVSYYGYLLGLVQSKKAQNYFEIGTNFGDSLAPVTCASVAVDPKFQLKMEVVGSKPTCLLYQMTSDDFFKKYDLQSVIGGEVDFAFLDGMHLYEFLLRDFLNTEKHCHKNSIIVLHDCLPGTFEMTNRQHKPAMGNKKYHNYWTGDVWKVIPILMKYRPDLKIVCVDCPPTGLAIITNLDPKSTVLESNYQAIIEEFKESENDLHKLKTFLSSIQVLESHKYPPELLPE